MGRSSKRCIICHVQTDTDVLKQNGGRCRSCAIAKAATDKGMTYGKMQGMAYSEQQAKIAEKERLVGMYARANKNQSKICIKCGGYIPNGTKYGYFCCRECKYEYEKQQREAIERGAIPKRSEGNSSQADDTSEGIVISGKLTQIKKCVNCGVTLRGRQTKYCSEECEYIYNREKRLEYGRQYNDAMRPVEMKRANLRCRICGGPITAPGRRKICSEECQKKAATLSKKEKRLKQEV